MNLPPVPHHQSQCVRWHSQRLQRYLEPVNLSPQLQVQHIVICIHHFTMFRHQCMVRMDMYHGNSTTALIHQLQCVSPTTTLLCYESYMAIYAYVKVARKVFVILQGIFSHPPMTQLFRLEKRSFYNKERGDWQTPNRETNSYYHPNLFCIQLVEPYFAPSSLVITSEMILSLSDVHKNYLNSAFGLIL